MVLINIIDITVLINIIDITVLLNISGVISANKY